MCVISNPHMARGDCYFDLSTGRQICTPPASGWQPLSSAARIAGLDVTSKAHCRICVGDGTTGSGTLIECNKTSGLVLTCSHLFDTSTQRIVVTFPDGQRFAAALIDRDRAHDLAALSIRAPQITPVAVSDERPTGELRACGFGPNGQFRCVAGGVTGQAKALGATYASLTIAGAVRPGDSGGGVFNTRSQLVGVVWGQRDGLTYATCGRPLHEFLDRIRSRRRIEDAPTRSPQPPAPSPQLDWHAWSTEMEARICALDAKKQDKGDYLLPGDLNAYLRIADAPKIDATQFAQRTDVDSGLKALAARFESVRITVESVRERVEKVVSTKSGFFQGLSLGKLIVGALGLSGPLAAAVIVAGSLAGRRLKRTNVSRDAPAERAQQPIVVDSPIPPQRTVPETHYVPIEKDSFATAHQWASEHVARKYPGATEILQAQDSLIKQFLASQP